MHGMAPRAFGTLRFFRDAAALNFAIAIRLATIQPGRASRQAVFFVGAEQAFGGSARIEGKLGQYLLMDYLNRKTRTIHSLKPGRGRLGYTCSFPE
jgi:hypothetical protein